MLNFQPARPLKLVEIPREEREENREKDRRKSPRGTPHPSPITYRLTTSSLAPTQGPFGAASRLSFASVPTHNSPQERKETKGEDWKEGGRLETLKHVSYLNFSKFCESFLRFPWACMM